MGGTYCGYLVFSSCKDFLGGHTLMRDRIALCSDTDIIFFNDIVDSGASELIAEITASDLVELHMSHADC